MNYLQKNLDWVDLNGYSKFGTYPAFGSSDTARLTNSDLQPYNYTINFYYERDKYSIRYYDGAYYDGQSASTVTDSMTRIDEAPNADGWGTKNGILFDADISSYGDEESDDYVSPTKTGYHFAGWYIDKDCTKPYVFEGQKMPDHDILVYAKWIENQYRVFLHPNVPASDQSLDWGSKDQDMNFRVSSGDKVSAPTGRRTDYDFIGWYLDEERQQPFNAETYILNDDSVTAVYDKTKDFTDDMDDHGNGATYNKDDEAHENRFWITRKLDLYAAWRAKLNGALGINVVYDANGGTEAPRDNLQYLDQAGAVAQAASTAPEGQRFLYWVVQRWDDSANDYVDADKTVYPGDSFTVLKDYAKVEEIEETVQEGVTVNKFYAVQLRAEYGPADAPTPTHIYWVGNGGVNAENEDIVSSNDVQINEKIDILPADTFTRTDGRAFLGWARLTEDEADVTRNEDGTIANYKETVELSYDDLWLTYHPAEPTRGDEVKDAYYTVKVTEDGETKDVAVTHVAADEKQDYHILYAVWANDYYVYHSGTGKLEAVAMPAEPNTTVDLSELADSNFYYGGSYEACGGISDEVLAQAKRQASSIVPTTASTQRVASATGVPYNGASTVAGTSNKFFQRSDVKSADDAKVTPVAGAVYYLKEVPTAYLENKVLYIYDWMDNNKITGVYLISVVDDLIYSKREYIVNGEVVSARVAKSLTFQVNGDGPVPENITIDSFENVNGGYLLIYQIPADSIEENAQFVIQPRWTTMDTIEVPGSRHSLDLGNLIFGGTQLAPASHAAPFAHGAVNNQVNAVEEDPDVLEEFVIELTEDNVVGVD